MSVIFQKAISLQLAVIELASYSIQFSIVGIGVTKGFGNWTGSFKPIINQMGLPICVNNALIGDGTYNIKGCPSITNFLGNLQISVIYPSAIPLDTPEPTCTNWEGHITLTGGSVVGILTRVSGDVTPSFYNVRGTYCTKYNNGVINRYINNLRIYSN